VTLKNNRVPDSLKDKVCTKFGQNPNDHEKEKNMQIFLGDGMN
jgi:hypothetical protein